MEPEFLTLKSCADGKEDQTTTQTVSIIPTIPVRESVLGYLKVAFTMSKEIQTRQCEVEIREDPVNVTLRIMCTLKRMDVSTFYVRLKISPHSHFWNQVNLPFLRVSTPTELYICSSCMSCISIRVGPTSAFLYLLWTYVNLNHSRVVNTDCTSMVPFSW